MPEKKNAASVSASKTIAYLNPQYNAAIDRGKNTVGMKLTKVRLDAGLTQNDLAEMLQEYGVNVRKAGISKWENGDRLPSIYQLIAICKALDIDEGLSYFMGEEAKRRPLNEAGLKKLADYKADLIASGRYKPAPLMRENKIRYISMPVSLLGVSAGIGEFLSEENFEEEQFPENFVADGADFGIRICGDSMEPVYHDGQIVWVERCEELEPGEVGIFMYDGDGYIKVYGEQEPDKAHQDEFTDSYGNIQMQPILISYNRKYAPKLISPQMRFQIVGRVL